MAKLVYSAITSLDGYVADASGEFRWAAPDADVFAFINDLERGAGTYLYGRRMYETMVYWETFDVNDETDEVERDFTTLWRSANKVVFSRTLTTTSSARTRLERSFDPDVIASMKETEVRDLSIGGSVLAAQALDAGLVDELHLFMTPIVVGGGTKALAAKHTLNLELLQVDQFLGGVVHVHYRLGT